MKLIAVRSFVPRVLGDRQGFEHSVDKGSVSSGVDRDQLPGEARRERRELGTQGFEAGCTPRGASERRI